MMLSSIWGGALADLYPKRSILVMTQAAQMTCAFLLAAGVWLGFASTGFIIVVAALNGIAMGFDMPARQAFTVEMTSREYALLEIFMQNPGRILPRNLICEKIWESQGDADANLLDVYMSRLRSKLESASAQPFFRTIRGVGYKMQ